MVTAEKDRGPKKASSYGVEHVLPGLGTRLREWRKVAGLKSFELARLIKISQGSLSDIENNKSFPSANTLAGIRKLTDMDMDYLFFGETLNKKVKAGPQYGEEVMSVQVKEPGTYALVRKE